MIIWSLSNKWSVCINPKGNARLPRCSSADSPKGTGKRSLPLWGSEMLQELITSTQLLRASHPSALRILFSRRGWWCRGKSSPQVGKGFPSLELLFSSRGPSTASVALPILNSHVTVFFLLYCPCDAWEHLPVALQAAIACCTLLCLLV